MLPVMNKPEPFGKQEAKSRAAQDTILKACIASLVEDGYAATSINRVVERAGISKGALQHHYRTKEELITAVAERLLEGSIARFEARATGDVAADLMHVWTGLISSKGYLALLEILMAARTDPGLKAQIAPTLKEWNDVIDDHMRAHYEPVAGEDVELLMIMGRSLMRGLLLQDRHVVDADYNLKIVTRWIALVAPLLKRKHTP